MTTAQKTKPLWLKEKEVMIKAQEALLAISKYQNAVNEMAKSDPHSVIGQMYSPLESTEQRSTIEIIKGMLKRDIHMIKFG